MGLLKRFDEGINKVVKILKQGEVIVYPTETCYGIGGDATNTEAVRKTYKIKERDFQQPTAILVSGITMAEEYVVFSTKAKALLKKFSTGILSKPLTLILPFKKHSPIPKEILISWDYLGIRISNHTIPNEIIRKLGKPILTSSANPKNGINPFSIEESMCQFKNKKYQPDFYLNGGNLQITPPSTVIVINEQEIQILREGSIPPKQILDFYKTL